MLIWTRFNDSMASDAKTFPDLGIGSSQQHIKQLNKIILFAQRPHIDFDQMVKIFLRMCRNQLIFGV